MICFFLIFCICIRDWKFPYLSWKAEYLKICPPFLVFHLILLNCIHSNLGQIKGCILYWGYSLVFGYCLCYVGDVLVVIDMTILLMTWMFSPCLLFSSYILDSDIIFLHKFHSIQDDRKVIMLYWQPVPYIFYMSAFLLTFHFQLSVILHL